MVELICEEFVLMVIYELCMLLVNICVYVEIMIVMEGIELE